MFGDFKNDRDDIFILEERKPTGRRTNISLCGISAGKESVTETTYHSPEYALQFENEFWVFLLVTVLTDEVDELGEMALLL